jgi:hypothetical protein
MKSPLVTTVAILTGVLVLLGYLLPTVSELVTLRAVLLGWAVILVAIASVVGIVNLALVHWRKATRKPERDIYSAVFLVFFLLTIAAGVVLGPKDPVFRLAVLSIQIPVESSLTAILAIVLAIASLRLLQRRRGVLSILFMFSAVIFLLIGSGLLSAAEAISPFKEIVALINLLPVAGSRGILLGIALGSLAAGLRILLGADRPYRG